jgi:hypothetical protein
MRGESSDQLHRAVQDFVGGEEGERSEPSDELLEVWIASQVSHLQPLDRSR